MRKRAILIAGPTASGKSAMAIELAHQHDGVIVNADSMQVYRELRILTARPDDEDLKAAPHRLYGTISAKTRFSVGGWLEEVGTILEEILAGGQLPIFVGGTGLYFKALTEGLAAIPDIPGEVSAVWRAREKIEGSESLHGLLSERDSKLASRIEPGDGQRIVRALAVLEATGRSLLDWQNETPEAPLLPLESCDARFLTPDREKLYGRIDARLDQMLEMGALAEIDALAALDIDPSLPAMKAHGVPQFIAMLRGELAREEAVARAKSDTRHYAKRQLTWFRHQMAGWSARPV